MFHTDLKTVEGDLSLYELGMIRRCLEKANRSFAERAVSAPKAEGNAGALKVLFPPEKKKSSQFWKFALV